LNEHEHIALSHVDEQLQEKHDDEHVIDDGFATPTA
jgi:hypothetical protein